MESIPMGGGKPLPTVGLGFWKIDRAQTAETAVDAIRLGYRHLDCASDYGNEAEVGQGIQKALSLGLCTRDSLWVTSKLWNTFHRKEHVALAVRKSMQDLQVDYLDLYLIHFPIALAFVSPEVRYPPGWVHDPEAELPAMRPDPVPIAETWEAMERLVDEGLVKNIGISNFGISLIRDLLSYARICPAVLQVELHPYLRQSKLLRYCANESIAVTGFSPLGAPSYIPLGMAQPEESVLHHPAIVDIAEQTGRTAAQVVLRWGIQRGTAVIPKSSSLEHLRENLMLYDFELTQSQMDSIDGLDQNRRFNDPGDFCEKAFGCFFPIYE
jgi:D-xylose reductase